MTGDVDQQSEKILKAFDDILQKTLSGHCLRCEDYKLIVKNVDSSSSYYIRCLPCQVEIANGEVSKSLTNFKAHISRPVHASNILKQRDREIHKKMMNTEKFPVEMEQSLKLCEKNTVDELSTKISSKYDATYRILKSSNKVMCTYCLKQLEMFPERGDCMNNLAEHVKSKDHIRYMSQKRRHQTIDHFMKSPK
jgi:hypothetical protein